MNIPGTRTVGGTYVGETCPNEDKNEGENTRTLLYLLAGKNEVDEQTNAGYTREKQVRKINKIELTVAGSSASTDAPSSCGRGGAQP